MEWEPRDKDFKITQKEKAHPDRIHLVPNDTSDLATMLLAIQIEQYKALHPNV